MKMNINNKCDLRELFEQNFEGKLSSEEKELINKIENMIKIKQIPETYPNYMIEDYGIKYYARRNYFIEQMGFVLLSWDWLNYIIEFLKDKKCLEVMSGCGSLTYALKQKGIDIIATDNYSWNGMSNWNINKNYWTDIENIDVIDAIEKYGQNIDVIIMSWAYMDDTAYKTLLKMREVNPNCTMIYLGENIGGCTANDEFFESIVDIENDLINKANYNYHRWFGIHDCIRLVR